MIGRDAVAEALLERLAGLQSGTTFCPSEVARSLSEDWRPLMPLVRQVAADGNDMCEVGCLTYLLVVVGGC